MQRLLFSQNDIEVNTSKVKKIINYAPILGAIEPIDANTRSVIAYYRKDDGTYAPSELALYDDVEVESEQVRIIAPANGREYFWGMFVPRNRDISLVYRAFRVYDVRDRAPVDTNKPAMPVYPGGFVPVVLDISELRQVAFKQVDSTSDALIKAGFVYQDILFSASLEAQIRYNAMMVVADTLQYPLPINSLDDTSALTLTDANETRQFCQAALLHVKNVVDSGSAEKERVRGMNSEEELRAFRDSRLPPLP